MDLDQDPLEQGTPPGTPFDEGPTPSTTEVAKLADVAATAATNQHPPTTADIQDADRMAAAAAAVTEAEEMEVEAAAANAIEFRARMAAEAETAAAAAGAAA